MASSDSFPKDSDRKSPIRKVRRSESLFTFTVQPSTVFGVLPAINNSNLVPNNECCALRAIGRQNHFMVEKYQVESFYERISNRLMVRLWL